MTMRTFDQYQAPVIATGTTSLSPAFSQATGAGHLLVAEVASWGTSNAITTSASGWSQASQVSNANGSSAIFYKPNSAASETAPTFSCTSATAMQGLLYEFNGILLSNPLDQTGTATGTASPIVCTMGGNDSAPSGLVVSADRWTLSKASAPTMANSWTNASDLVENGSSTSSTQNFLGSWGQGGNATGADSNSASNNSSKISNGSVAIASFKPFFPCYQSNVGVSSANESSHAVTLGQATTAGTLLFMTAIFAPSGAAGTDLTIAVTTGTAQTFVATPTGLQSSQTGLLHKAWYVAPCASGTTVVTVSETGGTAGGFVVSFAEFGNLNALDQNGSNSGSGTAWDTGSVTTTHSPEWWIAFGGAGGSNGVTWSGMTSRFMNTEVAGTTGTAQSCTHCLFGQPMATTGTADCSATQSLSDPWYGQIVTFYQATAAAAEPPPLRSVLQAVNRAAVF